MDAMGNTHILTYFSAGVLYVFIEGFHLPLRFGCTLLSTFTPRYVYFFGTCVTRGMRGASS